MRKVNVDIIGCGQISSIYLQHCTRTFDILDVGACADLPPEPARRRAEEFQIPRACTVEEILADPDVEITVNLTSSQAHAQIYLKALQAGNHVYTEKPSAWTREDADLVLNLACTKGPRACCAPNTFLGSGLQTCRKLIDDGAIGMPYAASGLILMGSIYDGMHPRFESYLQLGWDPLFDMAPYYLTAMVFLLGPVCRVTGSTGQVHRAITITNPQSPQVSMPSVG
jgi:predicted dehydrogenase